MFKQNAFVISKQKFWPIDFFSYNLPKMCLPLNLRKQTAIRKKTLQLATDTDPLLPKMSEQKNSLDCCPCLSRIIMTRWEHQKLLVQGQKIEHFDKCLHISKIFTY